MNKNYYDILEINRNASPEIIKKAYTTLAKKYHPDLQEESLKHVYEEKLKLINEAYEILSSPESKSNYDNSLDADISRVSKLNDDLANENIALKRELNNFKNSRNNFTSASNPKDTNNTPYYNVSNSSKTDYTSDASSDYENEIKYNEQLQQARQKAYYDAYIQDLKNRGYKIKYKKSFSDYCKNFVSFAITIAILFLLWHIPFIQKFLFSIYANNAFIKIIVDAFLGLFS